MQSARRHQAPVAPSPPTAPPFVDRVTGGVALWAVLAAFGTYFCMYAFRKPFTAAAYAETRLWGLDYKSVLVSAQVIGYTLSKFIGIRVIAQMIPRRRAAAILILIGLAQLSLLGFGLVGPPWNWICLFANGLPLGMVFGLVLGFLEGRRLTEALTAGLCASFICADGAVKSVGAWILSLGVSQYWMPALTGLLFCAPLLLFVWMLSRIPAPDAADTAARAVRTPMSRPERRAVVARLAGGLIPLVVLYTLITILRSVRADFAPEIWHDLGQAPDSGVFARSEMWVAIGVLLVNGSTVLIRDNRRAFHFALAICLAGLLLIAGTLLGLQTGTVGGFRFMVLTGLGLYLPYVAVQTTVFERLIAMTGVRANLGFLMYIADAFGYLGYVAVMLSRNMLPTGDDFLKPFQLMSWTIAVGGTGCLLLTWRHFTDPAPRVDHVPDVQESR